MPLTGKRTLLFVLAIAALAFSVYWNSMSGAIIFDDNNLVLKNPFIKKWDFLPVIFTSGFARLSETGANYYRPMQEFSYMLDNALFGANYRLWHVSSVLFHAGSGIVLFFLLRRFAKNDLAAFAGSCLFVTHPVFTSGVSYLSGRADCVSIFFVLSSFFFWTAPRRGPAELVPSFLLFLLGCLTKESVLIFSAVFVLYDIKNAPDIKKSAAPWAGLFAAAGLYLLIRGAALGGVFTSRYNVVADLSFGERILTAFQAIPEYVSIVFVPVSMHFERTMEKLSGPFDAGVLWGVALAAALGVYLVKFAGKKTPGYFGMVWMAVTYLPVSNFIIPLNAFVAENWIQMPVIGAFIAFFPWLAAFIAKLKAPISVAAVICVSVLAAGAVALCGYLTVERNRDYQDAMTFYERGLKAEPGSVKMMTSIMLEYEKMKLADKALEMGEKILLAAPDNIQALNNVGNVYSSRGQFDKAIDAYEKALARNPEQKTVLNNLGVAYIRKGNKAKALECWQMSVSLDPNQPGILAYIKRNQ